MMVLLGILLVRVTSVQAVIQTSHATLHLQENVSIAKVKFPIVPAVYEKAYTDDTLRTFEKYDVLTLTPNKIAVMYNWCQEQDTYGNDFTGHLYLACNVRIEFFSLSGERLQQEYYDTDGILRLQTSFSFFDPETFPEMKAIGFWVHGPHEGALSNKIVLALWTAVCPDADATRECTAGEDGCVISLRKRVTTKTAGSAQETFKETCMSDLWGLPLLSVKAGLRLCDAGEGSAPWPYQSAPDCFYYDLSLTDAAGKGWAKPADGKAHGYRLGSMSSISKDGGRYGSVYLVRFNPGGTTVEWIRRISSHAFLDYGEGIGNAVHAGEAVINGAAVGAATTEMQYSVTYHSHYWKRSSSGQVLLRRLCHVQIVRDNGELVDSANGGLLNRKCSQCSSQPMVRVHPQSHLWMSACSSSGGDGAGIYLNDNRVVDSLDSLRPGGVTSLDPDVLYSIDTNPQIIHTGSHEWLLFWKTLVTFPSHPVELFGPYVQAGRLMLAKYDATAKTFTSSPTVIIGGLSDPEYRSPRVSRFGEKTLLVGFYSSLRHTTTVLEVYEDGRVVTTKELQVDRTLAGILLNPASATGWRHHTDNTVFWMDQAVHSEGFDQYEALRPATVYPGFSLHLVKIRGHTTDGDCHVEWDPSVTCDNSCHTVQVLRENTSGPNCPLPPGSLRITPCSSGPSCEPVKVTEVVQVSLNDATMPEASDHARKQLFFDTRPEDLSHVAVEGVVPAFKGTTAIRKTQRLVKNSSTQFRAKSLAEHEPEAKPSSTARTQMRTSDMPEPLRAVPALMTADPLQLPSLVPLLFDHDVTTAIEFSDTDSASFAVFFDGGADIHEFSAAFLLDSNEWEEGLRLFCAAYDRFGTALVVREGIIGRLPQRNFLKPAGVNVSYWRWTNMRLFGVQTVQCTSGSASLLPSSAVPFAINNTLKVKSALTRTSPAGPGLMYPPSSNQSMSLPDRHTTKARTSSSRIFKRGTVKPWEANVMNYTPSGVHTRSLSAATASPSPSLRVAELVVLGRPNGGGACPPEGFFSHANCTSEASRPVFDLATLDCKGEWTEWTVCDSSCMSMRVFRKQKEAAWGGRPCQRVQKKPCGDGPYCTASSFASTLPNEGPLLPRQRECSYATGPWSDCLHCRQLRFHQILVEAAGPNVEACPDPIEMKYCNTSCRLQYDFAYTATSTYPPATTQKNPLPTFVPRPKVTNPLSWRRWYTMGRYTVAAFCLLALILVALLAACLLCSFKNGEQHQQQLGAGPIEDDSAVAGAPLSLAVIRRRTAAVVRAAVGSVVEFAEKSRARSEEKTEGCRIGSNNVEAGGGTADKSGALACEELFSENLGRTSQAPRTTSPS